MLTATLSDLTTGRPSFCLNLGMVFSVCCCAEQILQGQKSISQLQMAELTLLVIEGACVTLIAVSYVVRLLSTISMHRQALFSVFLAIPHGYLRTLASKSVSIGDDDEEDEGARSYDQQHACCKRMSERLPACAQEWLQSSALRDC